MLTKSVTMVVAALALGTAMNAAAVEPADVQDGLASQKVRYDDLNLDKAAGIAELHWRLRVAASNVCVQPTSNLRSPSRRTCRIQAVERALASLPAAVLAYHTQWKVDGANWLQKPESPAVQRMASGR